MPDQVAFRMETRASKRRKGNGETDPYKSNSARPTKKAPSSAKPTKKASRGPQLKAILPKAPKEILSRSRSRSPSKAELAYQTRDQPKLAKKQPSRAEDSVEAVNCKRFQYDVWKDINEVVLEALKVQSRDQLSAKDQQLLADLTHIEPEANNLDIQDRAQVTLEADFDIDTRLIRKEQLGFPDGNGLNGYSFLEMALDNTPIYDPALLEEPTLAAVTPTYETPSISSPSVPSSPLFSPSFFDDINQSGPPTHPSDFLIIADSGFEPEIFNYSDFLNDPDFPSDPEILNGSNNSIESDILIVPNTLTNPSIPTKTHPAHLPTPHATSSCTAPSRL